MTHTPTAHRLSVSLTLAALLCAGPVRGADPALAAALGPATITQTARGAVVETPRLRAEFRDGVLVGLRNRLTDEEYLDTSADLAAVVPHLPSGLGTQNGEPARDAAEKLYHWPWWEHPNDLYLPNQHYPDGKSGFRVQGSGGKAELAYTGLTDGKSRFADEVFKLTLEIDAATGDLLVTPEAISPRPGVYAANLTLAPLASAITAEAPLCDGLRVSRANTGQVLWTNQWPDYWQYAFVAFNGWKRGAVAIWAQDQKLRFYKNLFYLNNAEGLSFSLSLMNVPPFEELKSCRTPLPWRIQAFDKSWMQAVARYNAWRDTNVKLAPRPPAAQQISFVASLAGPQKAWLERYLRYVSPWQGHATAFLACVRAQSFDRNHADNTPVASLKEDTANWRAAGTYGMAYMQPMIMWGPFKPEAERSAREKQALALHKEADTHLVFQADPATVVQNIDQHHLGHPGWQRWFLDWVKEWCQVYGAQGIYHDQSYHCPIDRRGLAVGGMTTPEGMADYFYKAATENPGTFHGTEMVTEPNAVAVANSIGSGYHWGTAPNMRLARVYDSSPVTAALADPHTVLWSFVRLRGDSTWDLRERRMQEARGQIAGAIDGAYDYNVDPKWWPALCNTPWHDRTRDVTFLKFGLRPRFPEDYSRSVLSYFRGTNGEEFRYEKTPWGSQFVQLQKDGARTFVYGVASGVQAAPVTGAGIANWVVYNQDDPSHTWNRTGPAGLHPERFYVLDPNVPRPPVYFSTTQGYGPSFYESHVEDSGSSPYFVFLRVRTIGNLVRVTGWENLLLHSPAPPKAVYVNGQKTEVKLKEGTAGDYPLSVQAPADIVVILKDPPAALADLWQAALLRVTEVEHPVDYYRSEALRSLANGGVDEQKRPVLQDAAVSPFGFQFGSRKYLHVPVAAPAGSQGGVLRLHLSPGGTNAPAVNQRIEGVELNFQPLALATESTVKKTAEYKGAVYNQTAAVRGNLTIPEVLEIPLAPGEAKLLTLRTLPSAGASFHDVSKVTTRLAVEWVENVPAAAAPAPVAPK